MGGGRRPGGWLAAHQIGINLRRRKQPMWLGIEIAYMREHPAEVCGIAIDKEELLFQYFGPHELDDLAGWYSTFAQASAATRFFLYREGAVTEYARAQFFTELGSLQQERE